MNYIIATTVTLILLGSLACQKPPPKERAELKPQVTPVADVYIPKNSSGQSSLDSDAEFENPYGAILVPGGSFPKIANISLTEVSDDAIHEQTGLSSGNEKVFSAFGFLARDAETGEDAMPVSGIGVKVNAGQSTIPDETACLIVVNNPDTSSTLTYFVSNSNLSVTMNAFTGDYLVDCGVVVAGNFSAALITGVTSTTLMASFQPKPSSGTVTFTESIPTNSAVNVSFTDQNMNSGHISGNLNITAPAVEDFRFYSVYWGSNSTTKIGSSPFTEVAKTGSNLVATIASNTAIPPGATHLLVFTRNFNGEAVSGKSLPIVDKATPINAAISIAFTDTDTTTGEIGGEVTITKSASESDLTHYVLYWGSSSSTKQNSDPVVSISKTGSNLTYNFSANTAIPSSPAATHLLVYTKNGDGEMTSGVSLAITDNTGGAAFHRAFVTSTSYPGNLGGLAGADSICQTRANAASLGGTWKAILSDSSTNAVSRITISKPVKNMNSDTVANNSADFWDDHLVYPIGYNEFGAYIERNVWSGSYADGTGEGTQVCENWTAGTSSYYGKFGYSGEAPAEAYFWMNLGSTYCDTQYSLYCIDQ